MDIIGGLTAVKLSLDLAKELRHIDRTVDDATFRLKLADLTDALADAKISLSDAKIALSDSDTEIKILKAKLDDALNGDICPSCRTGRLQLTSARSEHRLGLHDYGVENWLMTCNGPDCGFEQTRKHDPHGILPKFAAKKIK